MLFASQLNKIKYYLPIWHRHKIKQNMRSLLEQKRRIMRKEEVEEQSKAILRMLTARPEWKEAKVILCYYPIHNEVNVRPLLEEWGDRKTLLLPVAHRRSMEVRPYAGHDKLKRGRFRIPEPQTEKYVGPIDLIIVPGVAFDRHMHRLGRGGGYYDRFLKGHPHTPKIAVAYDYQLVKEVPTTLFDRKVSAIVTPTEYITK